MPHFACIVGARPNFMKMAPLLRALDAQPGARTTLIHTGQHYDANLSDVFFEQLGMRRPDVALEVGSGKQGAQTAKVLERIEGVIEDFSTEGRPFDRMVVVGDVNSTLAAALAAVKLGVPVAHIEAGLRSFDRTMPEEINRIMTDAISDQLYVSEPVGMENLRREGRSEDQLFHVGNVMIDTLLHLLPAARDRNLAGEYGLPPRQYAVVTLHRPSNVDSPERLGELVDCLRTIARKWKLAFPIHPRTEKKLQEFGLLPRLQEAGVKLLPPLGYLEFVSLVAASRAVITDSGGIQEETTVLGVPCLTLRPNTERPITTELGTNTLVDGPLGRLLELVDDVDAGRYKEGRIPEFWDGRAAERIARLLCRSS